MLRIFAPAKVNLFLAVEGVRPDGFHDLQTIFQAVDLADVVELEVIDKGIQFASDWPGLAAGRDNLCWKAAELLQERSKATKGVAIRLYKRIPPGAGLGGGSSDAAAVLYGLNRLWRLGLSREEMNREAVELGADVAFFLEGGSALGKKRGESLSALPTPELSIVIIWPGIELSTAAVYRSWDKTPVTGKAALEAMFDSLQKNDITGIAGNLRNDLELPAIELCPECGVLKRQLLAAGCLNAIVSGAGSAVFGLVEDKEKADSIVEEFSRKGLWAYAAHSVSAEGKNERY